MVFYAKQSNEIVGCVALKKLDLAIGMYARMGFVEWPPPSSMTVLSRTEIVMKMNLQ